MMKKTDGKINTVLGQPRRNCHPPLVCTGEKFAPVQSGFTLIELLIVIIIIAALAVVVFVALNPVKRVQDARNARRRSDIEAILTAIHEYMIDNGALPPGLSSSGMVETQIGTGGIAAACGDIVTGGCNVKPGTPCVDLSMPLAKYLKSIPVDPLSGTAAETQYSASVSANNIITINACGAEGVNVAPNGSFELTIPWWPSPWYMWVTGGAVGFVGQSTTDSIDGLYAAELITTQSGPSIANVQFNSNTIAINAAKSYTVTYWAKSVANRQMYVAVQQNYPPYTTYGSQTVNLTTSWQQYSF